MWIGWNSASDRKFRHPQPLCANPRASAVGQGMRPVGVILNVLVDQSLHEDLAQ